MSAAEAFHDTNVVLYLLSADSRKAGRAEQLLGEGGRVSVQVLNEFAAVASRRLRMPWSEIRAILETVSQVCQVEPLTLETHAKAVDLAQRHQLGLYDASIVAAALLSGCSILYTEDLQHGQVFERRLRVVDPFHSAAPS